MIEEEQVAKAPATEVSEEMKAAAKLEITVKAPRTLDVYEFEFTGDLLIVRCLRTMFGRTQDASLVYKRVK